MNLIEKLGGYDSLKKEYEETLTMIQKGYESKSMEVIRLLLLEYRRENNIFEVGDLVVYVDDFMHDEINKVSNFNDRCWMNNDDAVCVLEMIRHATPEEIKAGYRL